jgi:short-subunit dehydrogenase
MFSLYAYNEVDVEVKPETRQKQKTALITGASSGIGAATALHLAQEGMRVILVARRQDRLESLVDDICSRHGEAAFIRADLTSLEEREYVIEQVSLQWGTPDILVNNAGIAWYGYYHEMEWETARSLCQLNVEAVMHMTRRFLPGMVERGSGLVVNIGSIIGRMPTQGTVMYSATKSFLDTFSISLYRELRGSGVTVSVIRPGPIITEFFDRTEQSSNGRRFPAERFAIPAERVAKAVARLIRQPRKVVYVPFWIGIVPALYNAVGWVVDLAGPLLLRRKK